MGLILVPLILLWIAIAIWPFRRFRKQGDRLRMRRIGLPFMLLMLFAPFWDWFLMLPPLYSTYFKYGAHEVYRTSEARSILVRSPPEGAFPGELQRNWTVHPLGLFQGKLDFVEAYAWLKEDGPNPSIPARLMRFNREPVGSEACITRISKTGLEGQFPGWCISYQLVEKSEAEVIIESGRYRVKPFSWMPNKQFQFSVWRAFDARNNKLIVNGVYGFMWRPYSCGSFDGCTYVINRNDWIHDVSMMRKAVPMAIEGYERRK